MCTECQRCQRRVFELSARDYAQTSKTLVQVVERSACAWTMSRAEIEESDVQSFNVQMRIGELNVSIELEQNHVT